MTGAPVQLELLADNRSPLLGLRVQMPMECPRCKGTAATIGAGRRGRLASLMCVCGQHLGWMGPQTHAFVTAIVHHFGRPTEPINAPADAALTIPAGGPYGFVRTIWTDVGGWMRRDNCVTALDAGRSSDGTNDPQCKEPINAKGN
jgi:hypothetical protein